MQKLRIKNSYVAKFRAQVNPPRRLAAARLANAGLGIDRHQDARKIRRP